MALDQVLAPSFYPHAGEDIVKSSFARHSRLQKETALCRVFPARHGDDLGEVFVTEIPNVDCGLAAYHWTNHHGYLIALREIVLEWVGCPKEIVEASVAKTKSATNTLEMLLATFYCKCFFDTFGRTPCVPCRLPHRSRERVVAACAFGSFFSCEFFLFSS